MDSILYVTELEERVVTAYIVRDWRALSQQ